MLVFAVLFCSSLSCWKHFMLQLFAHGIFDVYNILAPSILCIFTHKECCVTDNSMLLLYALVVVCWFGYWWFTLTEVLGWWWCVCHLWSWYDDCYLTSSLLLLPSPPSTSVHTNWFLRLPLVLGYRLTK